MYCYLEFKLRHLENLKLFSMRVKELFEQCSNNSFTLMLNEHIVLRKKMRRFFALFKKIFLRNRALSTAR